MSQSIEQEMTELVTDVTESVADVVEDKEKEDKEKEEKFFVTIGLGIGIGVGVTMTNFAIPGLGFILGGLSGVLAGRQLFYIKNPEEEKKFMEEKAPEWLNKWRNSVLMEYNHKY